VNWGEITTNKSALVPVVFKDTSFSYDRNILKRYNVCYMTSQAETNAAEYSNLKNWHGPLYASRTDSRIVVPKKSGLRGYTVNFAKPLGIGIHVLNIIILTMIVVMIYAKFFAR
jgi:uncharacterized membrane protein